MIAYRIQDRKRGTEYLLNPETQYSWPMDCDESKVRHGVSGCETIEGLAASWTFTLAVHAICGTMIKRHTVGAKAAWSRVPGWVRHHSETPLAALALACYLVREGRFDREGVEDLLVRSGWWS